MRLFDESIVETLNLLKSDAEVSFIGLGKYDFQLGLSYLHFKAYFRVDFNIEGLSTSWQNGGCEAKVWRLIGARPTEFKLLDPHKLKMSLDNGDSVIFHTDEGSYECVEIFGGRGEKATLSEIY